MGCRCPALCSLRLSTVTLFLAGMFSPPSSLVLFGLLAPALALTPVQRCANLAQTRIQHVHSLDTRYLRANETYRIPASCGTPDLLAQAPINVCVVNVIYNTSRASSTRIEAWLPDPEAWYGRVLGTGGSGVGGCVDYDNMKWGSTLHFAAFGHDGGHDGATGEAFIKSDEIVADYAYRGLHVAAQTSKLLVRAYYGRPQDKTYYVGCSNGGRQGLRNAQDCPDDFDGILAGAPAVNFIPVLGQMGRTNIAGRKLDEAAWALVKSELIRQCDGLDGLHDGAISEPNACQFLPEVLLCEGEKRDDCLSVEQVEAVRTIHSPLYGEHGELLSPRLDPGAVRSEQFFALAFDPNFNPLSLDWWRYVVYRNATWQPSPNFGLREIADAEKRDAKVQVSSWNPDISAFRKRGRKLLVWHGNQDLLIPSNTAIWYYQRVARRLSLPVSKMDDFYRLFVIPGMDHCGAGPGAWRFGQMSYAEWSNSSDSNALLALVDWVEKGKAPATLRGLTGAFPVDPADPTIETSRLHCSYPTRSVWKPEAQDWECVNFP